VVVGNDHDGQVRSRRPQRAQPLDFAPLEQFEEDNLDPALDNPLQRGVTPGDDVRTSRPIPQSGRVMTQGLDQPAARRIAGDQEDGDQVTAIR
jgi:hypothetical protein